ncbi:MAG: hypothetical protein FIB01_05740 [Gemmatimonadetes bacterium]|nr:hypothetical protein [Gemmatimonadota bacterium]
MLPFLATLLQAATIPEADGWWQRVKDFVDTPAPYSPFSEYLLLLFVLWLVARLEHSREERKKSFAKQAQEVLEAKYAAGEINRGTYEKYRQDVTMRPRH